MELNSRLSGRKVVRRQRVHDYEQLFLDDGAIINLFNRHKWFGPEWRSEATPTITAVEQHDQWFEIKFADASRVRIGLADDDFIGPEAVQYIAPDRVSIILS